jgi:4-amino-4-deoxy-L-arabinose transferase-like glycosyltransferase
MRPTGGREPAAAPPYLLLATLALAAVAAHAALMFGHLGAALFGFDSAEYALAGRTLAETGRLLTTFVHPALAGRVEGPPFPLVAGHPLLPVLEALVFRIGGARPELSLVPSALAFVALVPLAATLAWRVSRSRVLATLAGLAVALSPRLLRFATDGMSEMLFTALLTAALIVLWDLRERPRPLLLGFLLGLAHLARPVIVPLLPAWLLGLWWLAPPARRGRTLGLALAGFLPCAAVLTLYKWTMTGDPALDPTYLVLTGLEPGFTMGRLNRTVPPLDPGFLLDGPWPVLGKLAASGPPLLASALRMTGRACVLGFVVLAFLPGRSERLRRFQWTVLAMLALIAAVSALTVAQTRFAVPLLPVMTVLALEGARRLLAGARRPALRRLALPAAAALVLGTAALPLAAAWRRALVEGVPDRGGYRESEWRGLVAGIGPLLPGRGVVACDAAPWLGWYGGRATTQIPADPEELPALAEILPVSAIVVTDEWTIHQPGEEEWLSWYADLVPTPGWAVAGRVRSGRLAAVVYVPARRHDAGARAGLARLESAHGRPAHGRGAGAGQWRAGL